jgi:hypothetical protein
MLRSICRYPRARTAFAVMILGARCAAGAPEAVLHLPRSHLRFRNQSFLTWPALTRTFAELLIDC